MVEEILVCLDVAIEVLVMNPVNCRKPGYTIRPKPGLGHGTLVVTLRRNQSVPRRTASELTTVGLIRVSMGPPSEDQRENGGR